MSSNKNNSNDKEKDFLEEEFLKCNIDDLPIPKQDIENNNYEEYVKEIMKSGCNRQIAEYVILKYINLEKEEIEKDQNYKKLSYYREKYNEFKDSIISRTIDDIDNYVKKINNDKIDKCEIEGYDDELEEILENNTIQNLMNSEKSKFENISEIAKYYLREHLNNIVPEKKEEFKESRKKYIEKRDAVIEAALRKVKKIVNDEKEYKIFYKEYYGKDEPEEE